MHKFRKVCERLVSFGIVVGSKMTGNMEFVVPFYVLVRFDECELVVSRKEV